VDEPPIRELPDLVSQLAAVVVWVRPHRVVVRNDSIMAEVFGGLDQAMEGAACGIVEHPDLRLAVPVITEPEPTHGTSFPTNGKTSSETRQMLHQCAAAEVSRAVSRLDRPALFRWRLRGSAVEGFRRKRLRICLSG
jgi:hypothetical protein